MRAGCYDPTIQFKPQWAYATPAGFRDEPYELPFSFTVTANGQATYNLPWQLDDDQPFVLREIIFIALSNASSQAGLCRIRDSHGNPLSDDLVLALGAWCQSGFDNGFGFPIEPENVCEMGGSIIFDFQLSSNGSVAQAAINGVADTLFVAAQLFGTAGNSGLTIQLIDPGAPNVALSVAIVGGVHIQVTLATDGGGVITSTWSDVANIINSTPAVFALVGAIVTGTDPTEKATAVAQTPISGGADGTPTTLTGSLVGVKRFQECP